MRRGSRAPGVAEMFKLCADAVSSQILILQVGGGALFVLILFQFDRIVRALHDRKRPVWESLGRPPGFLWIPPDTSWFAGASARQKLIWDVAFKRPAWLKEDAIMIRDCWRFRFLYVVFWLFFIVWFVTGVFLGWFA